MYNGYTYSERRITMNPNKTQWWAYLHSNGTVQLKRWFGDVQDYTTDCEGNDFVQRVVKPFEAATQEEAQKIAYTKLGVTLNV
jgi:hypothetical protein